MTRTFKSMKYQEAVDALLGDPSISFWLKDAIKAMDQRDPVDALKDTAILLKLQKVRADEIFAQHKATDPVKE